jgi:hypothetical protein
MKHLKLFENYDQKLDESLSYLNDKSIDISDDELNSFDSLLLNRILYCMNDGQGDTNCYTINDMKNILSESDLKVNDDYVNGDEVVPNMKISEIVDEFTKDISANMSQFIFFDIKDNIYKKINWV